LSREIVPHKSLNSLRIQIFFFFLPTVNSENPSGMGLFHPFLRAILTLGNAPARCMICAMIQLSSIIHVEPVPQSSKPMISLSLDDTLGDRKLNSLSIKQFRTTKEGNSASISNSDHHLKVNTSLGANTLNAASTKGRVDEVTFSTPKVVHEGFEFWCNRGHLYFLISHHTLS